MKFSIKKSIILSTLFFTISGTICVKTKKNNSIVEFAREINPYIENRISSMVARYEQRVQEDPNYINKISLKTFKHLSKNVDTILENSYTTSIAFDCAKKIEAHPVIQNTLKDPTDISLVNEAGIVLGTILNTYAQKVLDEQLDKSSPNTDEELIQVFAPGFEVMIKASAYYLYLVQKSKNKNSN